jgi:Rrf2 family iron-sulfur cluster assembly transcriptional regulator
LTNRIGAETISHRDAYARASTASTPSPISETFVMHLTTKSRYGTRMLLDMAIHGNEGPVPLGDIAKRQNISLKYLEKLIPKLKKAGIVHSQRGPFGGHQLAKAPEEIRIGDIVRVLEGKTAITDCAERGDKLCGICNHAGDCLSRWVWIEASQAMFERLDTITLGMLIHHKEDLPGSA